MTREDVARKLISALSVTSGIETSFIHAAMRDEASVNGVAKDVVKIIYPKIMIRGMFFPYLDLVGDKFKTTLLASLGYLFLHIAQRIKPVRLWEILH